MTETERLKIGLIAMELEADIREPYLGSEFSRYFIFPFLRHDGSVSNYYSLSSNNRQLHELSRVCEDACIYTHKEKVELVEVFEGATSLEVRLFDDTSKCTSILSLTKKLNDNVSSR